GVKAYSKTKPINENEFGSLQDWWDKRVENERAWRVSFDDIANNGFNLDIKNPHVSAVERGYSSVELLGMLHESLRKSDDLLGVLQNTIIRK
ncbi:MAG: hypothetical protein ACRC2J_16640, partial [Microcoleaceae cyanobacterium]